MNILKAHDSLLLDLDGTVWEGGQPLRCVVDVINSCGVPAVYVTNNASRSPEAVASMLSEIGLQADPEHIVTSAQASLVLMAAEIPAGSKVLVIGAESFRTLTREAGYQVVDSAEDKPAAVVQGMDKALGWKELSEAAYAINNGAKFFATNLDTSLPTERGFAVGNGALVGAVAASTGVEPISAGKPEPAMFTYAAKKGRVEEASCRGRPPRHRYCRWQCSGDGHLPRAYRCIGRAGAHRGPGSSAPELHRCRLPRALAARCGGKARRTGRFPRPLRRI